MGLLLVDGVRFVYYFDYFVYNNLKVNPLKWTRSSNQLWSLGYEIPLIATPIVNNELEWNYFPIDSTLNQSQNINAKYFMWRFFVIAFLADLFIASLFVDLWVWFFHFQVAPSFDPTEYVQKQRVTKTAPPKPAYNPLQFIQIKPCNLYQSAQEQLKKAEEVKKSKVTKKEDAEDWQGVSTWETWKCTNNDNGPSISIPSINWLSIGPSPTKY